MDQVSYMHSNILSVPVLGMNLNCVPTLDGKVEVWPWGSTSLIWCLVCRHTSIHPFDDPTHLVITPTSQTQHEKLWSAHDEGQGFSKTTSRSACMACMFWSRQMNWFHYQKKRVIIKEFSLLHSLIRNIHRLHYRTWYSLSFRYHKHKVSLKQEE